MAKQPRQPPPLSGDAISEQGSATGRCEEPPPAQYHPALLLLLKGIGRVLSRCCAPSRTEAPPRRSRYSFHPVVFCYEVPDLCELDPEEKRELWYTSDDYHIFLNKGMEISNAYKAALDTDQAESFKSNPVLAEDSRRGLGLGRGQTRANNSQAYFTAVLDEQDRQHSLGIYDDEALASVAQEASAVEVQYSLMNALRDAEESLEYMAEEAAADEDVEEPAGEVLFEIRRSLKKSRTVASDRIFKSERAQTWRERAQSENFLSGAHSEGRLVDETDSENPDSPSSVARTPSKEQARGFGLSQVHLKEAGFLPSGRTCDGSTSPIMRRHSTGSPSERRRPSRPNTTKSHRSAFMEVIDDFRTSESSQSLPD